MGIHFEAALETLKRNGWSAPESDYRGPSNDILLREYIRRVLWWMRVLHVELNLWQSDLAKHLHPEFRLEEAPKTTLYRLSLATFPFTTTLCAHILEWANLRDHIDILDQYQLPDPYEPLLWMIQRGGLIHHDGDYIELWTGNQPYGARSTGSWMKRQIENWSEQPLIELNDAALDAVDAVARNKTP
jgi:hypothetical protein